MRLEALFEDKCHHVGVFTPLPPELAKKFPDLSEDDSVPHITVLYLGDQTKADEKKILKAAKAVAKEFKSFECKLNGLGYFDKNKNGQKIAFTKVVSKALHNLREKLVKMMKAEGVKWKDSYPGYKPHVTLQYLDDPSQEFDGEVPNGSWTCEKIAVWGFDRKHSISLDGPSGA